MKRANYHIESDNHNYLLIRDVGPWDEYLTVTNAAETVVKELSFHLGTRQLFYIDTDGQMDELLVKNGQFAGFAPGPKRVPSD